MQAYGSVQMYRFLFIYTYTQNNWIGRQIDRQTHRQVGSQIDKRVDKMRYDSTNKEGKIDRQTDSQIDRQKDGPDRLTEMNIDQ